MKQSVFACLLFCLAVGTIFVRGGAQETGMTANLRAVVEAERAFSRTAGERGIKDAFIAFAAPDGVVFRRAAVNARETWLATNPAPAGLLSWQPIYADVSRAGDLGYTTGPFEFRAHATDKDAQGNGHYVTLWRKQPDGSWKFEVDMGIQHPAPSSAAVSVLQYPATRKADEGGDARSLDVEAVRASLLDAERGLAKAYQSKGTEKAFLSFADADVRLYRQNSFPVIGRDASRAALVSRPGIVTWQTLKTGASRSGDLGYAYGTYELKQNAADAKPSEGGNFLRIWKKQRGGKWKIVLDETNPVTPPKN
ncbi:MAG: DUF4440 domain-containing protein [Pyrinomonadaceae bacterium]